MVSEKMIDAAARVLNKRLAEGNGLHGVSRDMIEAALFADTDAAQSGGETPVAFERLIERGQAFANQVRHVTYHLNGQAYSTTVSELNAFDADLRHARAALKGDSA